MIELPSLQQILVSGVVNGIGLFLVLLMRSAPPRIVLFLSVFSMCAIFVPWTSLVVSHADGNVRLHSLMVVNQGLSSLVASLDAPRQSISPSIIGVLFAIGLVWAGLTVLQSLRVRSRWRTTSWNDAELRSLAHPEFSRTLRRTSIRRLPGSSLVVSTGLFRAEVWIGERIQDQAQLRSALNHELSHIASGDQFTLFLVVVVERLLWWNPLVWLLGRQARRQMEYACDARCQRLMGARTYRNSLARLFLEQGSGAPALGVSLGDGSDIIGRMEKIGMKYSLKKSHIIALLAGSALVAVASTNLAAQDMAERPSLVQCHELLPENVQYNLEIISDIDTREGQMKTISMTLVDATKQGTENEHEIPEGAGEFLKCLQQVIGVGDDEGWPEV